MNRVLMILFILLLGVNAGFAWKSCKKKTAGKLCSIPAWKINTPGPAPVFLPGAVGLLK